MMGLGRSEADSGRGEDFKRKREGNVHKFGEDKRKRRGLTKYLSCISSFGNKQSLIYS